MASVIIVEGHSEVESIPILFRRIHSEFEPKRYFSILQNNIIRIPRSTLMREGEIERAVTAASIRLDREGNILVIIDADNDEPIALEQMLNLKAKAAVPHLNVEVVVAVREYESWIIYSISSVVGRRGFANEIVLPFNIENISGAKEWLSRHMIGKTYSETQDCPAISAIMDLALCKNSVSFKRFFDVVRSMD